MIHKTTRSILSVLLAALLLVTSIPLTPAFADGGAVSPQSESAEGRVLKPVNGEYQIYTADDLKEFAAIVNGTAEGINQNTSANAKLMNDIVLNEKIEVDDNGAVTNQEKLSEWTPIGTSSRYSGNFNGDGHTIKGLYINSEANYQGLFGYVSGSGKVQNLSVSGSVKGNDYVGGVVGRNLGTVENCYNTGTVTGNNFVGGIVGDNYPGASVKNCYNTGSVTGSGNSVGGVVGWNSSGGGVTNCYNTGSVSGNRYVGGVAGYNYGSVTNCYNIGTVTGTDDYVGGVVGDNYSSVTNCYNIGEVSGSGLYVGGVVGYNSGSSGGSSTVTDCYFLKQNPEIPGIGNGGGEEIGATAESVKDLNELCDKFKDDTTWTIHSVLGRPVLNENKEGGLGTEASPYEIKTADELKNFRDLVNDENGNPASWAVLMENITLNSSEEWTPIGNSEENAYTGTFNGDGHTISGLYINSSSDNYQGLFGRVSGTVQNLSVSGSVKVTGNGGRVGGVVGYNYSGGNVTNCYNTGDVNVTGNDGRVGGVVGWNSGNVTNCYNTGGVKVTGNGGRVGGVVGYNNGNVKNCYNTGTVQNLSVSGTVSGKMYVGGVVGDNYSSGIVENCYYQIDKGATVGIGGTTADDTTTVAKTAAEFQSGEVAYLLQGTQTTPVWGQSNLNTDKSWPTLSALDDNAQPVYKVTVVYGDYADAPKTETSYTNNPAKPAAPSRDGYTFGGWDKTGEGATTITYTAKWYSITASPSALDFGSITEGEERPAAQTVTVKNTGNQRVTLTQPTANNFEITTSDSLTLAPNAIASFTIQPKDNLPRGSYSEQITITGDNNVSETLTASFTVKEPPYTGKYSYELTTSVGDHGSLTVDRYATEGEKVTITVTPDEAYKLDDLSVTAGGKEVALTAGGDGTFSFTMPSADVKISATFAEDPDWTEPEEPATDVSDLFIDIAPDAWYKDAIQYAYDNGLMTGVSATEFAPEATTTRAMIVSILARLENVTTAQAAGFADVTDEWYATAVNWAANVGVVNGYEDNTFRPNQPITREQLAAILMNYAAYKGEDVSNRASLATYTDQPSTWAEEAMQWAVAEGLISGVTNTELQPQGNATRAQVAAILQRLLEA